MVAHQGADVPVSGPALVDLLQAVLAKGAQFRFRAAGFSMAPLVKDGDVVTISPLQERPPGLGDVVAFIHPGSGKLCVHRVVRKKKDSFFIRGDNAPVPDGLVRKADILGRVTALERNGRRIYLGLGPERVLIALLSGRGPLSSPLLPLWKLVRPLFKRKRA